MATARSPIDIVMTHCGKSSLGQQNGFVNSLRPYKGVSVHDFCELAIAIIDISRQRLPITIELAHALWELCILTRQWALRPDSSLRRNKVIDKSSVRRLQEWTDVIEWSSLWLIAGRPSSRVAIHYLNYVMSGGPIEFVDRTVDIIIECLNHGDEGVRETAATACGRLSAAAARLIPQLEGMLQDPIEDVRKSATTSLSELRGK